MQARMIESVVKPVKEKAFRNPVHKPHR